jgi:hypothetical protein
MFEVTGNAETAVGCGQAVPPNSDSGSNTTSSVELTAIKPLEKLHGRLFVEP